MNYYKMDHAHEGYITEQSFDGKEHFLSGQCKICGDRFKVAESKTPKKSVSAGSH